MKLYEQFQRHNVFRRPSWRFDRVLWILDRYPTPGRCTPRDDKETRVARKFMMRWRNKETREEREELFWENPGLFYALEIFEKMTEEPEPAHFMEARLLAGQGFAEIAEVMSTVEETVFWYEKLFFNVADHLRERDWITKHVLLPSMLQHHGLLPSQPTDDDGLVLPAPSSVVAKPFLDASLKLFAYFGGRHLVDLMITGFQLGKPLQSAEDMSMWFDQGWSTTIRRRSHQAALQFEINKYNVMELFATHTRIMEIEKSEDSQDRQRSTLERHVQQMLDSIPWQIGPSEGTDPLTRYYADKAGEPRDAEVQRLASGKDLSPERKKELAMVRPNPKRKPGMTLGPGQELIL